MSDPRTETVNFYDIRRGDVVDLGTGRGWEKVEGWSEGSGFVGGIRLLTDKGVLGWPEGREPSRSHTVLRQLPKEPDHD